MQLRTQGFHPPLLMNTLYQAQRTTREQKKKKKKELSCVYLIKRSQSVILMCGTFHIPTEVCQMSVKISLEQNKMLI